MAGSYDEGYAAAYESTGCAWEDATFATGFTAQAVVVRHLVDPTDFERMYHYWGDVFGPPSAKTIDDEPPTWPPTIALGEPCEERVCLHGAFAASGRHGERK